MGWSADVLKTLWFSLSSIGRSLALDVEWSLSFEVGFRFVFFCLGRLLVRLLLVAVMKLELAALRIGVGSARNIFCDVGMAFVGGRGVCAEAPKTDICDGGIQGASRCIRPRMCWGIRRAVASA
jgi:hypothetical protein